MSQGARMDLRRDTSPKWVPLTGWCKDCREGNCCYMSVPWCRCRECWSEETKEMLEIMRAREAAQ